MARRLPWLACVLALAACAPPTSSAPPMGGHGYGATPQPSAGLSGLVPGFQLGKDEALVQDLLLRPTYMAFPIRVGVLLYPDGSALKPEDAQQVMLDLETKLEGTGNVSQVIQLPPSLLESGYTLESVRKLASRFRTDAALIVSTKTTYGRADSQPLGFFDAFTSRAYYESRSTIEAFALNVFYGTFLAPFQAVGSAPAELLDPTSGGYPGDAYRLKKKAETEAWSELGRQLEKALVELKAATPPPSTSPTPTPAATPTPSAAPTATP